jgi:hypothetical protein
MPIAPHLMACGAAVLMLGTGAYSMVASRWAPGLLRILPRQRLRWRADGEDGETLCGAAYHAWGVVIFGCGLITGTLAVLLWP